MSVMLATVFLTVTFVTLVAALPTPSSRTKREVITVTQTRGSTTHTIDPSTHPCITVHNPNIPTTVGLSSPSTGSYELIGYKAVSTSTTTTLCSDDAIIPRQKLTNTLELNSRRPIKSFKLGKPTLTIHAVSVTFKLGTNLVSHPNIWESKCIDVGTFEARYPERIQILEKDSSTPANNYIDVYSSTCDDLQGLEAPEFLRFTNQNGTQVVRSTLRSQDQVVAFKILPIAQH